MSQFAETIQAAKTQAARARAVEGTAAAWKKAAEDQAAAQALVFLNSFVKPQVIMAQDALEAAGFRADVWKGETRGAVRCSLSIDGVTHRLIFTTAWAVTDQVPMPLVKISDGIGPDQESLLDISVVIAAITGFIDSAVRQMHA